MIQNVFLVIKADLIITDKTDVIEYYCSSAEENSVFVIGDDYEKRVYVS